MRVTSNRLTTGWVVLLLGLLLVVPSALAQTESGGEPLEDEPAVKAEPQDEATDDASGAEVEPEDEVAADAEDGAEALPGPSKEVAGLEDVTLSGAELDYEIVGDQLILKGNRRDLDMLEGLITVLEERREAKELRIITVKQKDANEIARTVEPALQEVFYAPNQRPEDELSVTALSPTALLVAALPEQIDFVERVILQADEVPETLAKVERLVFQVKHRKASDVAEELKEIITKLGAKQGDRAVEDKFQIIPNNANNTITVLAPESEREKIQALLDGIDVEPVSGWGEVKLTFYPLLHSKANEMADVIENLLESQQEREAAEETIYRLLISKALPSGELIELSPIDLQKPTRIIPDEGTNSLIVATVEENVGPMGELVRLLDGVAVAEGVDVRIFPLRFADAETVRDVLKEMFDSGEQLPEDPDGSGQGAVPEGEVGKALVYNIGFAADTRTNTLFVSGRPEQMSLVEKVIRELDCPASALKFPLRMIPLEHANASRVGQLMEDLLEKRFEAIEATVDGRAATERERIYLTVDIGSNSLLVSASEENYQEVLQIARQLDTEPVTHFDQIRVVVCERLSALDMKEKIDELWQRKADLRAEEELLDDSPVIAVDERSNALIIASSAEDFGEIERLVEALESQPLVDDTQLFSLTYTDAVVLADMLEELFEGIEGDTEAFKAPTIIPDPRTNTLVVAATRDGMERVEEVIGRLDVEAGPMTAIFKVYPLEHGSATKLAPRMEELFDSRAEGQERSQTPIVILADESSNSLVASASRDDHDIIVDLLELLDKPSSIARQFDIFPLKKAKAVTVAEKLESLFQSQAEGAQGRADAIAAEADERTNSIVVWASPSEMENIREVIARLDTSAPAVEMMIKVIQLKQALAEDFATLLDETLVGENAGQDDERAVIVSFMDKDADGRETLRKLLRQDIRIEPDPRTNSLMVMAPADAMAMLEAMIRDFDRIRPIQSEIRLFPLLNSDADSMVEQLEELFSEEAAEGETRSQLVFGSALGDVDFASVGQELRLAADPRTNTLIAAGAEVDLRMVEELVYYLDAQEAEDRMTEVYHVKFRDGQELANAIQGFIQQEQDVLAELDDEEARTRRMQRQVSVESVGQEEEGSSSLIVGMSRQEYQRTMDMISQLDRPEPQVMIQVLIAEVNLTDDAELGMEIAGQDLDFSGNAVLGPNGTVQGSDFDWVAGTDVGAAGLGLGGFNFTVTGEDFSFLFHAVQQNSKTEVLSRPILMIRNGEEGKITVADQVPIVESSRLSDTGQTQSTIGREDVGIVLTVTPQISPDGYVTLELVQEISNISGEDVQLTEGVSSPVFQDREVDTNVTVRDGETVVIGGLIQHRKSEGENKVPILGDLPILGPLFRFTSISDTRSELLVVLTVDIARTDVDMRQVSEEQRDQYELTPWIRQSPMMEGLRILPHEDRLGPTDEDSSEPPEVRPRPLERDLYGPKPRIYGPVIKRPAPASTAAAPVSGSPVMANGS